MTDLSPLDLAIRAARRGHDVAARRILDTVLADEPEHEEAILWRARVAETDGERAHLLRRAVALNPGNRWAADQLDSLAEVDEAAPMRASSAAAAPARNERIHHLQCPNCGGQVTVHPDRGSKAAACAHCGSILDLTGQQLEIIGKTRPKVGPRVPIEPGMEATFDGERYLVIGWLRYEGWDDEDRWTWDEWQLVSQRRGVRYLSHSSDEGFLLQAPVHPTPRVTGSGIETADGTVSFSETSPAKVKAIRGELTWRPELGKTLKVGEGSRGGQQYSVEMTAEEVEVVAGPALSDLEVWRAFGRDDLIRQAEKAQAHQAAYGRLAWPCWLATLAFLVAAAVASGVGETRLDAATTVATSASANAAAEARGVSAGAFGVDEAGQTVQLTVRADLTGSTTWTAPDVYVTDPSGLQHYLFTPDLWVEGGESSRSASRTFHAPEVGTYEVRIDLVESAQPSVSFGVEVGVGVWLARYFLFAAVAALLLGLLLKLAGGSGRPSY